MSRHCNSCIHILVETQVERNPDAIAIACGDTCLTYRHLNRRANQLAHYLRTLGVGPEVCVGVYLERSLDLVVAVLAILKAGGAYVPLDPAYPAERIRFMLGNARIPVLLTREVLLTMLPDMAVRSHMEATTRDLHVICLDQVWERIAGEREDNPINQSIPDHLAYVIYTSGSTGVPKGVEITHHSLLKLVTWHKQTFALSAQDRATLVASPAFDASVWEIWPYLASGASLHLPDEETRVTPSLLQDWMLTQSITISFLPTPLAERMLALDWPSSTPLHTLLTGGDKLTQYPRASLPFTLVNNYGPTESTVVATSGVVPPQLQAERLPAIGRALPYIELHLLDGDLCPVPIGEPGELYIGGEALARGYLDQPTLTAERFIPNPFSTVPGTRLYRTGDLARCLPDGCVEFLGRVDHQVKLRGYRIELGEIETMLGQHPAVGQVIVQLRDNGRGSNVLVAYIVPCAVVSVGELRSYLEQRLPTYMIPSAFVVIPMLPLTPNGKVDRNALPAPEQPHSNHEVSFVAPRTPVEAVIADAWSVALGLPHIGVDDNFIELGGHSLNATQAVLRIREALQTELTVRDLFERRTVAALAEHIERSRSTTGQLPVPSLAFASHNGMLPLSSAQRRLWFMDQLVPNSPLYNIALVFHLEGAVDNAALERAINEVVRRHEALRTTFDEVQGQPIQIIGVWRPVTLEVVDLTMLPAMVRRTRAEHLMQQRAREPFDLRHGPLLRVMLIRLEEDAYELLLTVHHIIFDGWSTGVLLEELRVLYTAFTTERPPTDGNVLPQLPLQYAHYTQWQHDYMQGAVLDVQLAYWSARFAEPVQLLELPTDRPRPVAQTYHGARTARPIDAALVKALEEVSRREEVSLFMTLFAAFQTLLHRYTGQTDIVVGVPIANRSRPEFEPLIGFFVNTLPLRVDLSGNPTFAELLGRVRQVALEAYSHQDLPLERLVEALGIERDLSYNPLFQVLFVMQNMPMPVVECPGVRITFAQEVDTRTAKFDIILFVDFPATGPVLTAEYNTDLFDADTIARMLGHFQTLLEGVVADQRQRLSDLPLLTVVEQQRLQIDWNDIRTDDLDNRCLHTLVEEQVARTPDAVAVLFDKEHLTYAELNSRANQLAHYLRKLGVGPDIPVALCAERSLEIAIGVLGILKAGGAYVPLDPSYPRERLQFMLENTEAPVLVAHYHLLDQLPPYRGHVICLDRHWQQIGSLPQSSPPPAAEPDNLLYILYTSGSTGRPKGVAMSHRSIVNLIEWQRRTTTLDHPARTLQFSPLSFDVSCQEIFFTWASGGTLVLIDDDTRRDAAGLLSVLDQAAVERIFLPFVALQHLAQTAIDQDIAAPRMLREIVTAGEQLQITPQIERFLALLPGCVLHNQYGPTESHVVTAFTLHGAPESWPALPPIGRPIANTIIRILDQHGQLVPVGVPGELYLGGLGLARGYLHRPELTNERFIPDPYSAQPGARLYRTGDLARYLPDGNIEFLGRIDHQVKIRGHRVELGEIETVLLQHPNVHEAVVMARESAQRQGDKRLIAYVVTDRPLDDQHDGPYADERQLAAEYRVFLKARLPEYMLPAAFMFLPALPLTPSGKVDRRALPELDHARAAMEESFAQQASAPRTPIEEVLAGIWAEVLGLDQVGIGDNFFDLGGHSLLAMQVMSQVRAAFGIELPLRCLFKAPTVEGLVAVLLEDPRTRTHVTRTAELLLTLVDLSEEEVERLLPQVA